MHDSSDFPHVLSTLVSSAAEWLSEGETECLAPEVILRNPARVGSSGWTLTFVRWQGCFVGVAVQDRSGNVYLSASSTAAASILHALHSRRATPRRITLSARVESWLRQANSSLSAREADELITMRFDGPAPSVPSAGRWARMDDIRRLAEYQVLYNNERGTSANPDWARAIVDNQIAVLEINNDIVSVVKRSGETKHFACLGGSYTIENCRRKGYAGELVNFLLSHILTERPSASLLVDASNMAARRLYSRAGFKEVGRCKILKLG